MHRSGREGVLFGVGLGPFSLGRPTGPKRPCSRAPTSQGRAAPLGGFGRISCRVPAPSFPSVTFQTPGITTTPKAPLFWPREPARSREEPPRSKGAEGRERGGGGGDTLQEVSRSPTDTTPIPLPPSNLLAFPSRFIPELTAGRPAEQHNQKQNEEVKTALGATHFSLCHLDPNFAGVRGCRVRTRDPLPLAHSCGLDLRLCSDCLGGPSAGRPRAGYREEAPRPELGGDSCLLPHSLACLLVNQPSCKAAYLPFTLGAHVRWLQETETLLFLQFSSVAHSCPTLCDPMDCSTLGLPVHHQLLQFTQTLVH